MSDQGGLVSRSAQLPPRQGLSWDEMWGDLPTALISCWDGGREKAAEEELAGACRRGELPILPWAGGVERALKSGRKAGSLQYLAMWQGIRGDDLAIDLAAEHVLVCSKTSTKVTFSADISKLSQPEPGAD